MTPKRLVLTQICLVSASGEVFVQENKPIGSKDSSQIAIPININCTTGGQRPIQTTIRPL
jgi:hypothetical protein